MAEAVKRRYESKLRTEQARETRQRIIAAARDLFVEQGYGRTTLTQVAEQAGVAVETIYGAFQNKRTLLRQVWFVDSRGDEEETTLFDRPEMQSILAEPDLPERIRRHAVFVTQANRRMAALIDALTGAAASEPQAADMLAEWAERRIDVATKTARAAAATGQLRIPEDECRDVLYATMDGALWQRLVIERGWTDGRYAAWLADIWTTQFVDQ